jgi:aminoglycoside 3-N-acetyltransferase I
LIPSDEYLSSLLSRADFHVVAAFFNDQLIGGLTAFELPLYKAEGAEMFLYEIAVEPGYRKQGVATGLIEYLKNTCVEKQVKEMYVGTSVNNQPAIKLYRATGGIADQEIAWFVYQCS